ncbi:MAG TPA: ABC transporter permease [Marmoricola sp.]|nr:ABC transporter permease [Marmoricola sp.]
MRAFGGVAVALVKGFVRDRSSVFFTLIFPLMFLTLFGGLLDFDASPRLDLIEVGSVQLLDDLEGGAEDAFESSFAVSHTDDRDAALADVRDGDADVAVEMDGKTLVAHYTQTDQVRAAMVRGTLSAFVDGANQALSGTPPTYDFRAESVEDESLEPIQFFTPGLLGWAVAMSAAFGAAATIQGWRQTKLLRRLQLSPTPSATFVSARVVVTVGIALVQMAIFLGLGTLAFGLTLTGTWWLSVPLLVVGTLSFMSIGLLSGAVAKTAEGAVNMANFIVMPMAFLSGSFFPLDAVPSWISTISWLLPLRHLNEGMIDVLVRGEGLSAILAPAAYILGFALLVGGAAVLLFRRARS